MSRLLTMRLSYGSAAWWACVASVVLAAAATVADPDSPDFAGGRLRVHIDLGASTGNRLSIGAPFSIDGDHNFYYQSTMIGEFRQAPIGLNDLVITFNSAATPAIVQELIRAMRLSTIDGTPGKRTLIFSLSDGDGAFSAEVVKTVNVT